VNNDQGRTVTSDPGRARRAEDSLALQFQTKLAASPLNICANSSYFHSKSRAKRIQNAGLEGS
jgi:hypothetical protein